MDLNNVMFMSLLLIVLFNTNCTPRYSNLMLKEAPDEVRIRVECLIFVTNIMVHALLFECVMHSHFPGVHEFFTLDIHCQFINVSPKHLKPSSQFIIKYV